MAGILIPAFSTRHDQDYGIGDTHSLKQWIDWAARHDVGFIQLLPINEHGSEESPYSAISSTAIDPIYLALDEDELPWLSAEDFNRARDKAGPMRELNDVDYPRVRALKRTVLELAWSHFNEASADKRQQFAAFQHDEASWLNDYCTFRYLMECHGESLNWSQWPEECRTPEQARHYLRELRKQDSGEIVDYRLGFHAFCQWLCFRQWRDVRSHADRAGVRLMGDIPIGVAFHSCDVFFDRDDFHLDWFGGSPAEGGHPDDAFLERWGQNWGIPLYRWERMADNGYHWWRERIRRLKEVFHLFRLDHILGFYRIYAFPWHPSDNARFIGKTADEAAQMTGGRLPCWWQRADDTPEDRQANLRDGDHRLRAVLKDSSMSEVIAEDLGWVPDYVRPHLAQLGIGGFKIPHWDCDAQGQPTPADQFPEKSLACYSTHDHEPIHSVWQACSRLIRDHQEHGSGDHWQLEGARNTLRILCQFAEIPLPDPTRPPAYSESIRLCLVSALMASRSRLALVMVTELFNIDRRINSPGSQSSMNWTFRIPWKIDEIEGDHKLKEIGRKLSIAIHLGGRVAKPSAAAPNC